LRGLDGIAAIAAKHEVHPMQVSQWKKEVLERLPEVFATKKPPGVSDAEAREAKLYQKIGQLEMEVDWLKKNLSSSLANKRAMVEPKHRGLLPTPIQSKRR
jgi:putative transposase